MIDLAPGDKVIITMTRYNVWTWQGNTSFEAKIIKASASRLVFTPVQRRNLQIEVNRDSSSFVSVARDIPQRACAPGIELRRINNQIRNLKSARCEAEHHGYTLKHADESIELLQDYKVLLNRHST